MPGCIVQQLCSRAVFYIKMPLDQNIPVCYTAIDIKRTERGPDIKFFKKVGSAINSRAFAYTSFVLSVCAAVFLSSATWTYGWIADIYPLGDKFVPTLLGVICACAAVNLIYLLICAFAGDKKDSLCPAQRSGRSYGFPSGLRQAYRRPEFRHRRH